MAKVTFDGDLKLITVNEGITELSASIDLYSDWKEWVVQGNNLGYLPAFRTLGGDPTVEGARLGSTYFMMNGWKLDVKNITGVMTLDGNLYQEGGGNFIVVTSGTNQNTIIRTVSNLVDTVVTSGSSLTAQEIANAVLDTEV